MRAICNYSVNQLKKYALRTLQRIAKAEILTVQSISYMLSMKCTKKTEGAALRLSWELAQAQFNPLFSTKPVPLRSVSLTAQ